MLVEFHILINNKLYTANDYDIIIYLCELYLMKKKIEKIDNFSIYHVNNESEYLKESYYDKFTYNNGAKLFFFITNNDILDKLINKCITNAYYFVINVDHVTYNKLTKLILTKMFTFWGYPTEAIPEFNNKIDIVNGIITHILETFQSYPKLSNITDINLRCIIYDQLINYFNGNICQLINFHYENTIMTHVIDIDPRKPYESIVGHLDEISSYKWEFMYREQIAVDRGGIARDFYYILSRDIEPYFSMEENYLFIGNNHCVTLWHNIGKIICRSIFIDKISIGLNLHPYFFYKILTELSNNKLELIRYMYVDTAKNIMDLVSRDENEYKKICYELFDKDEIISKDIFIDKYLNKIYEKDDNISNAIKSFSLGFISVIKHHHRFNLLFFLNPAILQDMTFGMNKYGRYNIYGDHTSLDKNLFVESFSSDLTDADKIRMIFLKELNKLSFELQKKLIRFWIGTPFVNNFSLISPKLTISDSNKGNVFISHTCFYQLIIPYRDIKWELEDLGIAYMMYKSISNQDFADEHFLYMQTI